MNLITFRCRISGNFLVSLILLLFVIDSWATNRVGVFKTPMGNVIVRHKLSKALTVEEDMPFYEGSKIKTSNDSGVKLEFNDGSRVEIGADTLFMVKTKSTEAGKDTTLDLFGGVARTEVHKLNSNQVFSVRSPSAVAGVRGTVFDTMVSPSAKMVVQCYSTEGSGVSVRSPTGQQMVGAGFVAHVSAAGKIKLKKLETKSNVVTVVRRQQSGSDKKSEGADSNEPPSLQESQDNNEDFMNDSTSGLLTFDGLDGLGQSIINEVNSSTSQSISQEQANQIINNNILETQINSKRLQLQYRHRKTA
jgi:hypothetical protein